MGDFGIIYFWEGFFLVERFCIRVLGFRVAIVVRKVGGRSDGRVLFC